MKIRALVLGAGAMGMGIAKALYEKEGIDLVGIYARRKEKDGKDLGELLGFDQPTGIIISNDLDKVLKQKADIVIQATTSFISEAYPQIEEIINSNKNLITLAEEMAYPAATDPILAEKINSLAIKKGVTVLGTGINPGFVLDTLILSLTGACVNVHSIKASRVNDLSPFGATVMRTQGVGTTVEEFEKGIQDGSIVGHIGFAESINMIADALGWKLDKIKQTKEPIVSNSYRETPYVKVEPGMVAGCRHIAYGMSNDEVLITLEHPQQICPEKEGIETGDYIWIEGQPSINMAIKPEIPGGLGTIAMAVNMIPSVIDAKPGLVSMTDLPFPRALPVLCNNPVQLSHSAGKRAL
jgi:hypothetical protein